MLGFNQGALPISFDQIPKTEQHVHIEATASLALLRKMAQRNDLLDIYQEIEPYLYQFTARNFLEFLTAYDLISLFINTPQDVEEMVLEYLQRCQAEGLTHVAMTCSFDHAKAERAIFIDFNKDPKDYTQVEQIAAKVREQLKAKKKSPNLTYPQYVDAVANAIRKSKITAEIIMVLLRHNGPDQANALLKEIEAYPHPDVTTIGLAGDEVNFPAKLFSDSFAHARKLGLKIAPHVCELAPPKFLADALSDMGPLCRVGHAITTPGDLPENRSTMERIYNLSNPAMYFLKQPGLKDGTRVLLQQLAHNGILENDVDEANLKSQLEEVYVDETSKECLQYLFQPLCIELSPTSNLLLIDNINSLEDHPLPKFVKEGIRVSINSDDPKFWSDRVRGAEGFSGAHFERSPEGCSVGMEWKKVQRIFKLSDAQMLKIYRDSVVSMGCHKLLKICLLNHAYLYEVFHDLKRQLTPHGNFNTTLLFANYEREPTMENAQAILVSTQELNESLGGFDEEVKTAEELVAKHKAYATAIEAYQQHREAEFLVFNTKMSLTIDDASAKRKELTY